MHSVPLHYLTEAFKCLHKPMKSNFCQLTLCFSTALSQLYDHNKHLSPSSTGLLCNLAAQKLVLAKLDWGSEEAGRKGWKSWSRLPLKCRRKRPLTPGIPLRLARHASCFRLISFWFEFFCSTHPQVNHCRVWKKKKKKTNTDYFSASVITWTGNTAKPQNAHPSAKPGQNCSSPVTLTLQLARIYTQILPLCFVEKSGQSIRVNSFLPKAWDVI